MHKRKHIMRTTIDLDDAIIKAAMKVTGAKTKKEVVHLALDELVRKQRQENMTKLRGTFPDMLTASNLQKLRAQ